MKYFKHIMDGKFMFFRPESDPNTSFPLDPMNMLYASMMADPDAVIEEVDDTPVLTYADNRRAAYGNLGDQLDMQYHDAVDGTTTWKDHVAAVKAEHPKP